QTITLASGSTLNVGADGNFTYVPKSGFAGFDVFTYTAFDGVESATGTVTIEVTDQAPTLDDVSYRVAEGHTLIAAANGSTGTYGVLHTDSDGDSDSITITAVNGSS